MMMTALMIFLGASACMTTFIVAALAVGARRKAPIFDLEPACAGNNLELRSQSGAQLRPAFGQL